jgi:HK97 family phage major capsid protein
MNIRQKFEAARDRAAALRAQSERSDEEQAEMEQMLSRAEALKADLDEADKVDARIEALGEVSRAVAIPGTAVQSREPAEMSIGEYIVAAGKLVNGQMSTDEFVSRAGRYLDADVVSRATTLTTDVAGVIPAPIIGPIIDLYDDRRKVWNSFTTRSMPSEGKTFEVPRVTQHVAVGEQAAEGDTLTSQKWTATSDTVTKRTFGGTLELPRQVIDWTDPAVLGYTVQDFVKVYTRFTEAAAVTHLTGLATATSTYDDTDLASVVDSYVTGALAVGTALDDDVPLTLWMDVATAAGHTQPVGSTDRTEWSVIRQALDALDSSVTVVVSRRLPADTRIIGAGELVMAYEQRHGLLSVVKPTNLTTDISYSGYAAFHGIASGFVSVEAA